MVPAPIARLSWLVAVALVGGLVGLFPVLPASAAAVPSIGRLSTTAGPLSPVKVTIHGRGFRGADRVTFGGVRGTKLLRIGDRKITVWTPRRSTPARVAVRVHSPRGWSRITAASHYTFLSRPTVTKVTPAAGPVTGGTRFTVAGTGLRSGARVYVAGQPAKSVRVTSGGSLKATSPAGLAGTFRVSVTTAGGASPKSPAATFTYTIPAAGSDSTYTPGADTVTAVGVAWVMGGTSVVAPRAGQLRPWTVGLRPGTTAPLVGEPYFLAPGSDVFPAGLAGTVTEVADQADGGVAVTVAPTAIEDTLNDAHVNFSGPIGEVLDPALRSRSRTGKQHGLEVGRGVDFGKLSPNAFLCRNGAGREVSFRGDLGLRLEDVHAGYKFDTGGLFGDPDISLWVSGQTVVYGKVSVTAKVTCNLLPAWANARRKIIPLGTTGATVSFGPTASFSVSGSGTFSVEHRTSRLFGFETGPDGGIEAMNVSRNLGRKVSASGALTLNASAGLSTQLGILDRVGFQGTVGLALTGSATASGPPPEVCVSAALAARTSLGVFLDLWIARWEQKAFEATLDLGRFETCSDPESPTGADPNPVIATTRLPSATNGTPYDNMLTTTDGRAGRWSLAGGSLPTGLTLHAGSGAVTGTPNDGVRDFSFDVRFTDGAGRSTVSGVRLYVRAEVLSGGDVQASLTWSSTADLDLHVIDPDGDEIWYRNPGPTDEGGFLDHDANAACGEQAVHPAENVVWPTGQAPLGHYQVWVELWGDCSAPDLSWHLVVRTHGEVVLDTTGSGTSDLFDVSLGGAHAKVTRGASPQSHRVPKN